MMARIPPSTLLRGGKASEALPTMTRTLLKPCKAVRTTEVLGRAASMEAGFIDSVAGGALGLAATVATDDNSDLGWAELPGSEAEEVRPARDELFPD